MIKAIGNIGKYLILLKKAFGRPERYSVYYSQTIREIEKHGIGSILIVVIVSLFVGAAITIQTNYNIQNPLLPAYLVGVAVRDSLLLEFSSTMIGLVLAGKIGSSIVSEIGMMKVTEQIDALEVMGINAPGYLLLPKIIATVLFTPLLCVLSVGIGILGGYFVCLIGDVVSVSDFISGIQYEFFPHYLPYAMIKTAFYAFIIASVSGYFGFNVKGGAVEVGRSSTKAVVLNCILILLADLTLTNIILQ